MCEAEVIWSELVSRWPEVKPLVLACTSLQPLPSNFLNGGDAN